MKAVADGEGNLIKARQYDSFGGPIHDTAPALYIPIGFGGGLRDRHTGLVRFVNRDYDPRTGRFTASDPMGDTGGDHDLYEYCVDDPVNAEDPWGLEWDAFKPLKKVSKFIKSLGDVLGPASDAYDLKKANDALANAVDNRAPIQEKWSEGIKDGDADKIMESWDENVANMKDSIRMIGD